MGHIAAFRKSFSFVSHRVEVSLPWHRRREKNHSRPACTTGLPNVFFEEHPTSRADSSCFVKVLVSVRK